MCGELKNVLLSRLSVLGKEIMFYEVREMVWGQVMNIFKSQIEHFIFYPRGNREPLKCLERELGTGDIIWECQLSRR